MAHKRVVRILAYEGNEEWINATLKRSIFITGKGGLADIVVFNPGTIRELYRIELEEGENLVDAMVKVGVLIPSEEAVKSLV